MSMGLVSPRQKKVSRQPRVRAAKSRAATRRLGKLDLDGEEIALHAAISAAVARDLGR